jgi:isocitrate dehydrogenase (NAD+)
MTRERQIEEAKAKFGELLSAQLARADRINAAKQSVDYKRLDKIIIGFVGGDGIGPSITFQAARVLRRLLKDDEAAGKIEFRDIEMTIEKRVEEGRAIPEKALAEILGCHVVLKGPTTTPRVGDYPVNIESANVAMRKELDLFANVRPVRLPEQGIDWTFFRENTEGAYAVGDAGIEVSDDLSVDFAVATTEGSERIIRAAFEFAAANGKTRVTAVTKANIIKTTDGKFLSVFYRVAKEYPNIEADDWYIDIMTAKLIDEKRRGAFQVFALPNLYGDILTDEAAEIQGGVGTAGSANLGKRYAMFEAIHGSAPRMVKEGREIYADPSSVMRAAAMLLGHIGYAERSEKFHKALDICGRSERKFITTGRSSGATTAQFADYVTDTIMKL